MRKLLLITMMLTFHQGRSFCLDNAPKLVNSMGFGQRFDLISKRINPLNIYPTLLFLFARQTPSHRIAAIFESSPAFYNTFIRLHSIGMNGRFLVNHRLLGLYGFFDFSVQDNPASIVHLLNFCSVNFGFETLIKNYQVHCNLYVPLHAYDHCGYDYIACARENTTKDSIVRQANYLESGNLGGDINVQHSFYTYPVTLSVGNYLFYDQSNNTLNASRWIVGGTLKLTWQWDSTWLVYTQISVDNSQRSSSIALGVQSQFSTSNVAESLWKATVVRHISPLFAPEYTNVSKRIVNRKLLSRQCEQHFQGNQLLAIQEVAVIMNHCNTSIACLIAEKNKDNHLINVPVWSNNIDIAQLDEFMPRRMHLAIHPDKKNFIANHATQLTTQQRRDNFLIAWPKVLKLSLRQDKQMKLTVNDRESFNTDPTRE